MAPPVKSIHDEFDAAPSVHDEFDAAPEAPPATAAPSVAPQPEPSFLEKIASALKPKYSVGDAATRASTDWLQAISGGAGQVVFPRAFAAADYLGDTLNGIPSNYDDSLRQHQRDWNHDVDPTAVAIGSVPLSLALGQVAPAANTMRGLFALNTLQAAGRRDIQGQDLMNLPAVARVGGEAATMTAIPYALKGAGWLAGQAADFAAPMAKTLGQFVRGGYVTPTPAAQRLMDEGVDMTLGKMDPGSVISRFEEIAANNATGSSLAAQRDAVGPAALNVLFKKATAPGMTPPTPGAPVGEQVKELKAGYSQLYDEALKGQRISPDLDLGNGVRRGLFTDPSLQGAAKTKGAFELAADGVRDASSSVRRRALAWLTDAAETKGLTPYKSGADAGDVDATSIQALRTKIDDKLRSLGREGDDRSFREIYERAKDYVSDILHTRLPTEKAAQLRSVDAKYRDYLAMADASEGKIAHRNEGEFTADNLLDSIWKKDGVSPELKQAALDFREVSNPTYPKTGALPGAAQSFLEGKYFGPLFAKAANADAGLRAHALGQLPAPGWLRSTANAADSVARYGPAIQDATGSPVASATTLRTLMDVLRASAYSEGQ